MAAPVAGSGPTMMTPPAAGGGGRPAKFNNAPPPATIYSAEVALAAAAQAVEVAKRGVRHNAASGMLPGARGPPRLWGIACQWAVLNGDVQLLQTELRSVILLACVVAIIKQVLFLPALSACRQHVPEDVY